MLSAAVVIGSLKVLRFILQNDLDPLSSCSKPFEVGSIAQLLEHLTAGFNIFFTFNTSLASSLLGKIFSR